MSAMGSYARRYTSFMKRLPSPIPRIRSDTDRARTCSPRRANTPGGAIVLPDGWTSAREAEEGESALSREAAPQRHAAKAVPHPDAGVTRKSRRVPLSGYVAVGA